MGLFDSIRYSGRANSFNKTADHAAREFTFSEKKRELSEAELNWVSGGLNPQPLPPSPPEPPSARRRQ